MPEYTDAQLTQLSQDFREYMQGLSLEDRNYTRDLLKEALGIKNASNVVRWYTSGTVQRDICNRRQSVEGFEARIAVVECLLNRRNINSPQKIRDSNAGATRDGKVLARYLEDDYTRASMNRITVSSLNGLSIEYDSDSGGGEGVVTDEDVDEWSDVIEE